MSEFKYSAKKIAELLRESGVAMHDPTEEQAAIIESWPLTPSVVIAGAGSGGYGPAGAWEKCLPGPGSGLPG